MIIPRKFRFLGGLFFLGLCFLWGGYEGNSPSRMLEELERDALDLYREMESHPRGDRNIVLVLARETSSRKFGLWPWSRKIHGRMVQLLGNARTIVLDLIFPDNQSSEEDLFLAQAVKEHGNCIVGAHFVKEGDENVLILPYPELAASARYLGVTNVVPDLDGLYRFITPLWDYGRGSLPSISLAACLGDTGISPGITREPRGISLLLGERALPMEPFGGIWIAPWNYEDYPVYEYVDVLEGKVPWSSFEDALVIVGMDVSGAMVQDMVTMPWKTGTRTISGAAFVALGMETLLYGNPPRALFRHEIAFWVLFWGVLGGMAGFFCNPRWSWTVLLLLLGGLLGIPFFLLKHVGLWFPPVIPLLELLLVYMVALFIRLVGLYRSLRLGNFYSEVLSSLTKQEGVITPGAYLKEVWPKIQELTSITLLKKHASPKRMEKLLEGGGRLLTREEGTWLIKIPFSPFPYRLFIQPPSGWGGLLELGWKRRVSREDLKRAVALVLSISWFGVALRREEERLRAFQGAIRAVAAAVDAKDPETRGHSDRVALLSRALAEALELPSEFVEELHFGALLHDVGKIGIPDAILQKPSRLCEEEFEAMKAHPLLGQGILEPVHLPKVAVQGILEHHERLDGSGYPKGLKGDEISLAGRIVAVADAFDALSSRRTYKDQWSLERIFAYFRENRGVRYDAKVVDALFRIGETWYEEELPGGGLKESKTGKEEVLE
ncbi:MAG TPA: CHASE2 domain-containing protein [Synergistaceae bacterium]|nr:CHASE2 domain-containing protein [Synergistaceae bacterium]